jgi:release factor glutamine methyltransferase
MRSTWPIRNRGSARSEGPAGRPFSPTVREALAGATLRLRRRASLAARAAASEARFLLAEALDLEPGELVLALDREVTAREVALVDHGVECRAAGVPLQYVLGSWDFFGARFRVERGVLIPRPETECLVEAVLARLPEGAAGAAIDLGTGAGVIAITLKRLRPALAMRAIDSDPCAVRLARLNAATHGVDVDVRLARFDEGAAAVSPSRAGPGGPGRGGVSGAASGATRYRLVVANPPYVSSRDLARLDRGVRDHEPRHALAGGADGLDPLRAILAGWAPHLAPGGLLACEIGSDQGARARRLARQAGLASVEIAPDLARRDRVLLAVRGGP